MKIKLILILLLMPFVSIGQDLIEVDYVKNQDNSLSFNFSKKNPGTYFLIIDFKSLRNTESSKRQTKILKYNNGPLFKLKPNSANQQIEFQWSYKYYKGNINSKIKPNFKYILPFKKGETVTPVELFSVEKVYFDSELPKGWKSYSFSFDETKSVKAIRKGVVVDIKNNFEIDTLKIVDYYSNQNSISVEHKDGTVANYTGFNKNKINVKLGETVFPQTELGELAKFDSRSLYRLYLSLSYYKTINGKSLNNINSSDDYKILYLTPKFFQNGELIELKNGNNYKVQFDEKTLYMEMRKREIKKHKSSYL